MFPLNNKLKIILPIIIFSIVVITLTVVLVCINKNDNLEENKNVDKEKVTLEKDIYGISSLTEKYIVYDIDVEYCDNGRISKISGLKNKEVENKINQKVSGCKYMEGTIIGNTLSFVNYDSPSKASYLSIRLDNGEEYNFEDLFLSETNIEYIISQAANYYYTCLYNDNNSKCFRSYDYDVEGYAKKPANFDLEEEVFKIINLYKDEGVKGFFVSNVIEIQIGDIDLFLPLESVWQDLAIYKRFLTDQNIFTKESELTNYVLSFYRGSKYNKFLLDNLFLEEYDFYQNEYSNKVSSEVIRQNENIKSEIIEMATKDKNNVYFLLVDPYVYDIDDIYVNSSNFLLYKMNKTDYERLGGEEFLASEQRESMMGPGFAFSDDYAKNVNIENLILTNYKAVDKNGKEVNNYCYLEDDWYKKGEIIEIWSATLKTYLVEENCTLTLQ